MRTFEEYIKFPMKPMAKEESMVYFENMRITVLTSRLLRVEYSKEKTFRDEATKTVINRNLPTPKFDVESDDKNFKLETEHLVVNYKKHPRGFTRDTFTVYVKETNRKWFYGTHISNLKGTCRTLDHTDGGCELESGLMSKEGIAIVEDTTSFTFDETGWFKETYYPAGVYEDFYIFGHGQDYKGCLKEYMQIAGKVPMLPRWALGNWWSRYWEYSDQELLGVMDRFEKEEIPLSVCIVDMDWHITDVSGGGTGGWHAGWTGYTWNKDLFPDPKGFMDNLHDRGIKTSLNLHPADGLMPHEEMYEEMANFMGMDPADEEQIPFDITDKKFVQGYFEIMHRPHEEMGVDFWWMDWQQGLKTKNSHLDPLFLLNHLHYLDGGRYEDQRGFVFSRWGGLGNHRYPIGFSGDTDVTWASLKFQPYVTSTAANVGYGWWSHDIGGHHHSKMDTELYARWAQYGVFSPIMRLHSTKCTYEDRHPWNYPQEVLDITRDVMQFRHQLIPYIYTMSWLNYRDDVPFILPLYYNHPECAEAYVQDTMYYFGEQLIAAPYVDPMDQELGLTHQNVWLPEGEWFDFFNGDYYKGNAHYPLYSKLEDIPVFAKAGSIVPLGEKTSESGVALPKNMELHVYPGAEGEFTLFEDDGETQGFAKGLFAETKFTQVGTEKTAQLTIHPIDGYSEVLPSERTYQFILKGFTKPNKIVAKCSGEEKELQFTYDAITKTTTIDRLDANFDQEVGVVVECETSIKDTTRDLNKSLDKLLNNARMRSSFKEFINQNRAEMFEDPYKIMMTNHRKYMTDTFMKAVVEIVRDKPLHQLR